MEYDRTDLGQWQPPERDLCQHCEHDWHGLVCRTYGCYCLGSHLLEATHKDRKKT